MPFLAQPPSEHDVGSVVVNTSVHFRYDAVLFNDILQVRRNIFSSVPVTKKLCLQNALLELPLIVDKVTSDFQVRVRFQRRS